MEQVNPNDEEDHIHHREPVHEDITECQPRSANAYREIDSVEIRFGKTGEDMDEIPLEERELGSYRRSSRDDVGVLQHCECGENQDPIYQNIGDMNNQCIADNIYQNIDSLNRVDLVRTDQNVDETRRNDGMDAVTESGVGSSQEETQVPRRGLVTVRDDSSVHVSVPESECDRNSQTRDDSDSDHDYVDILLGKNKIDAFMDETIGTTCDGINGSCYQVNIKNSSPSFRPSMLDRPEISYEISVVFPKEIKPDIADGANACESDFTNPFQASCEPDNRHTAAPHQHSPNDGRFLHDEAQSVDLYDSDSLPSDVDLYTASDEGGQDLAEAASAVTNITSSNIRNRDEPGHPTPQAIQYLGESEQVNQSDQCRLEGSSVSGHSNFDQQKSYSVSTLGSSGHETVPDDYSTDSGINPATLGGQVEKVGTLDKGVHICVQSGSSNTHHVEGEESDLLSDSGEQEPCDTEKVSMEISDEPESNEFSITSHVDDPNSICSDSDIFTLSHSENRKDFSIDFDRHEPSSSYFP
jgi:hypothetical protein